ncbi:MAG: hypothetical protein HOC74_43160 [Gemmatimonadetes bacterium]|nr:hypothetical protein [Gemmatimonadota bacterium]
MDRIRGWLAAAVGCLVLLMASAGEAGSGQAFIPEVTGKARVVKGDGGESPAAAGGELAIGDALHVDEGKAALIYLSGRAVEVGAGQVHEVRKGKGKESALMEKIAGTLGEIVGPQSEADRPVVHGMARDLGGITGALPVNTRLSREKFVFTWDALEDAEEFEFRLETEDGEVLTKKMVKGTRLDAKELKLKPGERYVWSVQETGSFLPRDSGKGWVEIASEKEAKELKKGMAAIESSAEGESLPVLKAANFYREGYFYDAEQALRDLEGKRSLSHLEQKLLTMAYVKMERWDRLPESKEKAKE